MQPAISATDAAQRTSWSDSYIHIPGAETLPWFAAEPAPFIYFAPKPEPMAAGDLRASLLHAADYLDEALDSQLDGDHDALRHNLAVLRSIVDVVAGQLDGASSEYAVTLQ